MYQLAVTALFKRLVAELPAGTASVHLRQSTLGAVIEVKPTNPACADFWVLANDFELYMFGIGESRWGFRWGRRRYRKGEKDVLTEIEEMARAVIAGNCEQRGGPFWLIRKIHVGDYTYTVMHFDKFANFSPFWARRYAPFVTIGKPPAVTSEKSL